MNGAEKDEIQFRGPAEKEALAAVNDVRLGGINASEIVRQGVREMLQRTISDEERVKLHQRYERGDLGEEAARVLLGDALDEIERERDAFASAMELKTDGVFEG